MFTKSVVIDIKEAALTTRISPMFAPKIWTIEDPKKVGDDAFAKRNWAPAKRGLELRAQ